MHPVQAPLEYQSDSPRRKHEEPVREPGGPAATAATGTARKAESERDDGNYARNDQPRCAYQHSGPLPAATRQGPKPAEQKIDVEPHPADGKTKHQDLQWIEFTTSEGQCKHADDEQASNGCCASERSFGSSA
jgi:hypothetical protein